MSVLPYYLCYLIPVSFYVGYALGGWYNFLAFSLAFILVPIADMFSGLDHKNPTKEEEAELKKQLKFKIVTWLWTPVQYAIVIWGAWIVSTQNLSAIELVGFTLGAGLCGGGIGITITHELVHRTEKWEKFLSLANLVCLNYMHFYIEHVYGHHQRVATPNDPATSKKGESFWYFYPRTVIGSWKSAWSWEVNRISKKGKKPFHINNRMLHYVCIQLGFFSILYAYFGIAGVLFHLVQSTLSFSLLEIINYVEHYGLLRKKNEKGRYEKVLPIHSWNASHQVSNMFLFKLQRHSDHHANGLRRYQILRYFNESPQLPFGYPTMSLIALFPPLWRKVMDPRLEAYRYQLNNLEMKREKTMRA